METACLGEYKCGKGDNGNEKELTRVFSKYGKLLSVWVAQRPAGFAFIEYEDNDDAEGNSFHFYRRCWKIFGFFFK